MNCLPTMLSCQCYGLSNHIFKCELINIRHSYKQYGLVKYLDRSWFPFHYVFNITTTRNRLSQTLDTFQCTSHCCFREDAPPPLLKSSITCPEFTNKIFSLQLQNIVSNSYIKHSLKSLCSTISLAIQYPCCRFK